MNTLCIYVFHIYNDRVKHFIENALYKDDNTDFLFIANDTSITRNTIKLPNYCKFENRKNIGYDFGAWSYGILKDNVYKEYDYFMFINSSVIGPYVENKEKWIDIFTSNLKDNLKLYGCTINTINSPMKSSHVQSYLFCVNKNTLEYLIEQNIFSLTKYAKTFHEAIFHREVRMSRIILQKGWNIGCRMKIFKNVDFTFKDVDVKLKKINDWIPIPSDMIDDEDMMFDVELTHWLFENDMMYESYEHKAWTREELIFIKGNRVRWR